jgi:hypothetical protein
MRRRALAIGVAAWSVCTGDWVVNPGNVTQVFRRIDIVIDSHPAFAYNDECALQVVRAAESTFGRTAAFTTRRRPA